MGAGLLEDDDERRGGSVERHNRAANCIVAASPIAFCLACLLLIVCTSLHDFAPPVLWVKVPGVEGLDQSTDADATAPTFHITLRVNYERRAYHHRPLCGNRGSVVVSYAGVPLARGDLPEFCVPAGTVGSVPVLATSEGLGLPDELYERMQSQRRRRERVPLAVHVRIEELTGSHSSAAPVLLWCTAILHGQPKGPFICPVVK